MTPTRAAWIATMASSEFQLPAHRSTSRSIGPEFSGIDAIVMTSDAPRPIAPRHMVRATPAAELAMTTSGHDDSRAFNSGYRHNVPRPFEARRFRTAPASPARRSRAQRAANSRRDTSSPCTSRGRSRPIALSARTVPWPVEGGTMPSAVTAIPSAPSSSALRPPPLTLTTCWSSPLACRPEANAPASFRRRSVPRR